MSGAVPYVFDRAGEIFHTAPTQPAPIADVRAAIEKAREYSEPLEHYVKRLNASRTPSIGQLLSRQTLNMDRAMRDRMFSRLFPTVLTRQQRVLRRALRGE